MRKEGELLGRGRAKTDREKEREREYERARKYPTTNLVALSQARLGHGLLDLHANVF